VIDLAEDDLDIIEKMIHFLYTQNYDERRSTKTATDTSKSTLEPSKTLYINTTLNIADEKWDIAALKTLAEEKFESIVSAEWKCPSFTSCLELLDAVFTGTDRLLEDVNIKVAASHIEELVNSCMFANLCKKTGEIGFDVLKASVSPVSTSKTATYRQAMSLVRAL